MGPSPCQEKHPQNILLGLCLTVTAMQVGSNTSWGSCHTLPLRPCSNCVKVLSSENSTRLHCLDVQCSCACAHSSRARRFASEMAGLRRGMQDRSPTFLRARRIV